MVPDGFPAGLRVFVVDEDSVALRMLEKMLLQCGYKGVFFLISSGDYSKYRKGLKRNTIELNQQIFYNAKARRESENQFESQQFALNNDLNDNNNFDELATLLALEQKQPQNSSDSGAQINMDSVDVQSYSLEDLWGSNASNLAILSEFENMDDTDELYVALSSFQY
ncbi:uncharacterized protein LOC110110750 [Dendrobium catenatum]|uniref:uncharacterized protein LOC110110750 n=1 Tax=Dendrobium catenatum TaxID=906689 RepID=UPI0010A06D36|nr:uncharacterized protein LOC110110750 [Dendrobium catenatum]